jgi:hypothetical protein
VRIHLLTHTDRREAVSCPFKSCSKTYRFRGSLSSHFSRYHKEATALDVKGSTLVPETDPAGTIDPLPVVNNGSCPSSPLHLPRSLEKHVSDSAPSDVAFSNALCDMYNVLMHEKKVPYTTIDYMVKKMVAFEVIATIF